MDNCRAANESMDLYILDDLDLLNYPPSSCSGFYAYLIEFKKLAITVFLLIKDAPIDLTITSNLSVKVENINLKNPVP